MKAWKAALAAAIATAGIALVVVAPMAQSSRSPGGLKVVAASSGLHFPQAVAKCPRGYVVIGGGFVAVNGGVTNSGKVDERRWVVAVNTGDKSSVLAQAICAKGTGGFQVTDKGEVGGD